MSFGKRSLLSAALMLFAATPLLAQEPAAAQAVPAEETSVVMRRQLPAPTGVKLGAEQNVQQAAAAETAALQPAVATRGQGRTLMIVGVASILVGAIVGGDAGTVFMVGGGVIGLYGLYSYLR